MTEPVRVVLEAGKRWTFATAIDWPGWCRRGRGTEAALEELLRYAPRYAVVAGPASPAADPEAVTWQVVATVPGTATTDFGAPDARGPWDEEPLDAAEAARRVALLDRCWTVFDDVVAGAPASLRKGPRGGGRDRDAMAAHVQESERSYARSVGVRVPPRTPWSEQRVAIRATLLGDVSGTAWSPRYVVARMAWHVLDHAWEMQDRSV